MFEQLKTLSIAFLKYLLLDLEVVDTTEFFWLMWLRGVLVTFCCFLFMYFFRAFLLSHYIILFPIISLVFIILGIGFTVLIAILKKDKLL